LKQCGACGSPYEAAMRFCPECGKALLPALNPLPALLAATPSSIRLPAEMPPSLTGPVLPMAAAPAGGIIDSPPAAVPAELAAGRRRKTSAGTQRWSDVEDRSAQIAADSALLSWQAQFERRVMPVVVVGAALALLTVYSTYFERGEETDAGLAFAAAPPAQPTSAGPQVQSPPDFAVSDNGSPAGSMAQVQLATLLAITPVSAVASPEVRSKPLAEEPAPAQAMKPAPQVRPTPAAASTPVETAPAIDPPKAVAAMEAKKANGTRTKSAPDRPREDKTMVAEAEPAPVSHAAQEVPPAPQPVAAALPPVSADPDWLVALRAEMDGCRKHGFFERTVCVERAKWKHCAASAWGTLPECPGRRQQAGQRPSVSVSLLD
jgi:hypothetical protein